MPEGFKGAQANSGAMLCRVISPLQGQIRQIAKGPRLIQKTCDERFNRNTGTGRNVAQNKDTKPRPLGQV